MLTFAGGFAVAKGYVDPAQMETLVGAAVTLIGAAWSLWSKREPGQA